MTEKKNVYCLVLEEMEIFGKKWVKISGLLLPKLASSVLSDLTSEKKPLHLGLEKSGIGGAFQDEGKQVRKCNFSIPCN